MSVLIENMEMPKNCYDCPFAMQDYTTLFGNNFKQTRNSYACVLTHKAITSTKRNRFCPLITVPSHGRLIDADALEQDAQERLLICNENNNQFQKPYEIMRAIACAPTIIEEEGER